MKRERIAIVGAGISGLACARFLHPRHDITVFEKDDRSGGHSHTVMADEGDREVPVDTGFMVYNEVTYPLLTRLFKELRVETKSAPMSFSVQHLPDGVEFNGGGFNLLFGQRRNLVRPRFWRMLLQIDRFNREAVEEVRMPRYPDLSLVDYAGTRGYGRDFLEWYLLPMAAAVWSSPPDRIRAFPAETLLRFWYNHGFLGLDTQHPWRTVHGGSREYVRKLSEPFASRIRKNAPVQAVTHDNRVILEGGASHAFDKVIIAAHADQALRLLEKPTALEHRILSAFPYQKNTAILHRDRRFMPRTRRCRASWNYRIDQAGHSTHYWMNSLQQVSDRHDYYVSINPSTVPDEAEVIRRMEYEHPLFDLKAIATQGCIGGLHAAGHETGRFFCGAWQRHGFHEDGLWSAWKLCESVCGEDPWS